MAAVAALACSDPLPPSKQDYAGRWAGQEVTLEIEADGSIHYKRSEGSTQIEINAPIMEFQGDDFVVGLWTFKTTFQVSSPPHWDGKSWTMVVDGRLLTRSSDPPDPTDAAEI